MGAESCAGCVYSFKGPDGVTACEYILKTGQRRPCPPGAGCTAKKTALGPRKAEPMRVKWDQARAKELWLEGKSDREIARAVGATKAAVTTWRQRVGLTRASSAPADEAPEPPAPESAAAEGGSGPDETGPGGPVAMTLELCGGYAELRAPGFKEARRLLLMMGWSLDAMEGGWPDE